MAFDTCWECKVRKVGRGIHVLYKDGLGVGVEWLGKYATGLELGATTITWEAASSVFTPSFFYFLPSKCTSCFSTSSSIISISCVNNYVGHACLLVSFSFVVWNGRGHSRHQGHCLNVRKS